MYPVLALLLVVLTLISLVTSVLAWREVRTGRAHIDTIRDLTGIVDRDEIVRLFGPADGALRFAVTPARIHDARTPLGVLSSSAWLDALLIISLSYALMLGEGPRGWGVIAIAALYNLAAYVIAALLFLRHRAQIAEEI